MDVKNAFLDKELEEEVYMGLSSGFDGGNEGRNVCRLKKIYLWAEAITKSLV